MGINTYQIATEGNIESNSNYKGYLDSTTGNTKCITANRLLKGLLLTSNTPTYNTSNTNGFATTYQLKHYGYSATTTVNLQKGSTVGSLTSTLISTNATYYSGYPFSTGTGVLAINSNYTTTINATITVTCVSSTLATSDDGVSTASLDFDNPTDDTESNTNGQEPTLAGNMSRAFCSNPGAGDDGCTCHTGVTANISCPSNCLTDGVCLSVDHIYSTSVGLALQIYTGTVDGEDKYTTLVSNSSPFSLTTGSNKSASITLSIPSSKGFNISGTPTTAFKFRVQGTFTGVGTVGSAYITAKITAIIPRIYFTVYNPGPRCIPYSYLSTVYSLY